MNVRCGVAWRGAGLAVGVLGVFGVGCAEVSGSIDGRDTETEVETEVESEVEFETESETESEVGVETESETKSEVRSETVSVTLVAADDAVASYLLSPAGDWNLFSGTSVPIGRHFDDAHVGYHTALRFRAVPVPRGARVTSARLTFFPTNEVDSSNALWINLYAEASGDSAPFDPRAFESGRPDQRARTVAHIDHWLVRCNADCTELTEYDCPQRQRDCWDRTVAFEVPKDLSALVAEVFARPDWAAGNAVTVLLVNAATDEDGPKYSESRSLSTIDPARGEGFAPRLEVTFETP